MISLLAEFTSVQWRPYVSSCLDHRHLHCCVLTKFLFLRRWLLTIDYKPNRKSKVQSSLFLLLSQIGKRRGSLHELRQQQQKRNLVFGFFVANWCNERNIWVWKKLKIFSFSESTIEISFRAKKILENIVLWLWIYSCIYCNCMSGLFFHVSTLKHQ